MSAMRVPPVVALLLVVVAMAHAQEPAGSVNGLVRDLQGKRVHDMSRFCARSDNRLGSVFSAHMVEAGQDESAVLDCLVGADGKARACVVVSRTGIEVGQAALRLGCRMHVDVAALARGEGGSTSAMQAYRTDAGWRLRMPVLFRVEN